MSDPASPRSTPPGEPRSRRRRRALAWGLALLGLLTLLIGLGLMWLDLDRALQRLQY